MGLSASQARLLTITGRKSDCEFQSMGLSHQKIALARELADLSNEYQNSIDQTKLIYDYYGTGDQSRPLSYGILMTPSALNDYMPTLITDSSGRAVLDSKYAEAARAAGIPQEGLGTLPSENLRNAFVTALAGTGAITGDLATRITGLPYNQGAGFGGGATVAVMTKEVTLDELAECFNDYSTQPLMIGGLNSDYTESITLFDLTGNNYWCNNIENSSNTIENKLGCEEQEGGENVQVSLKDLLQGNYIMISSTQGNATSTVGSVGGAIDAIVYSPVWEDIFAACENVLDIGDGYTAKALEYARVNVEDMISNKCENKGENAQEDKNRYNDEISEYFAFASKDNKVGNSNNIAKLKNDLVESGYIGLVYRGNTDSGEDDKNNLKSNIGVNISAVFKAFLTYFVDYLNGVSAIDAYGNEQYSVDNTVKGSNLVDNNTRFTVKIGTEVSSDDLGQAQFYDALFNQICANGWTENDNVNDNDYLKEMLQNGMMYISKMKDDGYYYQGNYAIDAYIKEVADETLIAQAEAKYNTEKAKLNAKEETLDLKMKNLDTEISSLTTEYDTVKNIITKQIEKSFKRYSA